MIERQVHCRQWHGTKNKRAAKILFHNPVCRLFPKTWKLSQTCIDLVTGHFDSTLKCHICPSSPFDRKTKFRADESKVNCNLWIRVNFHESNLLSSVFLRKHRASLSSSKISSSTVGRGVPPNDVSNLRSFFFRDRRSDQRPVYQAVGPTQDSGCCGWEEGKVTKSSNGPSQAQKVEHD